MMTKTMLIIASVAMCLFLSLSVSAQVANGDFEQGTDPGAWATVGPGQTNITNWTVDFGSVDYIGTYWMGSNGPRSVDLNGNERGGISQSLITTAGITYQVTFDMSGNPDGPPDLKLMTVTADGGQAQQFSYDIAVQQNSLADMKWMTYTYYFTATGDSTVLSFTSNVEGYYGPALDNVSVVAITAQICHRDKGKPGEKTLIVGVAAVPAHLAHGDYEGPCTVELF